jgi:mono/diheme cytochrome c family protein
MFNAKTLLLLLATPALQGADPSAATTLSFERHIRPILKAQCFHCHGEGGETKGGLDLRLARFIKKGGESGPAIVAGDAAKSHLLEMVKQGEMPKGKAKLKEREIALLEQWIAQGAPTARPEPEKLGPEQAFTDEERAWWSLQPIAKVKVPQNGEAHPIDAFVAEKLREVGLEFSPRADDATLLRRLSFTLTGLPADAADMEQAKAATFRTNLERLLQSPQYGERWARHWLDIAGYADSDGYTERDLERPWSWKYRDYVIAAFNKDKPYDQFVREQLAGDEMLAQPLKNLSPEAIEKLTATGFLRMAADGTGAMNDKAAQNACIADTLKIIGTAFYGLTVGCAQCHDHRYDPITHEDYHRLRAIFEPGFNPQSWRTPAGRLVSLQTDTEKAQADQIEAEAKVLDAKRIKQQEAFITEVLEKELLKAPEDQRKALRDAYRAPKRSAAQAALLKAWPRINQLSAGSLYLYDTTYKTQHANTLKKMSEEAAAVRARKPAESFVQAFTELPMTEKTLPATHLFFRGDIEQPRQKVRPGELSVLAGQRQVDIAEKDPKLPTSGRRLAYAQSLTDGRHPLLARVIVNQVWLRHFGRGLAENPNDFGQLGQPPSHPQLLDWLAQEFMNQGWSLKRLHRLILTSRTWQQQSRRDAKRDQLDPDNRWLSRMSVRRLEAETLRDSLLWVSGQLNAQLGGKPVPVTLSEEGQVVVGVDTRDSAGRPTGKSVDLNGQEKRRSIYVAARRSQPLEMFAAFDAPAMTEANCALRPNTTVSPQSLLLMNNLVMRQHAQDLAQRVERDSLASDSARIILAWRLALGRNPRPAELEQASALLEAQTKHYEANPVPLEGASGSAAKTPAAAPLLALSTLCHALLSSNAFLYVD